MSEKITEKEREALASYAYRQQLSLGSVLHNILEKAWIAGRRWSQAIDDAEARDGEMNIVRAWLDSPRRHYRDRGRLEAVARVPVPGRRDRAQGCGHVRAAADGNGEPIGGEATVKKSSRKLLTVHQKIAETLCDLEHLFVPGMMLTFVARHPDGAEKSLFCSNDQDFEKMQAVIKDLAKTEDLRLVSEETNP
jgi:hypothetical protein